MMREQVADKRVAAERAEVHKLVAAVREQGGKQLAALLEANHALAQENKCELSAVSLADLEQMSGWQTKQYHDLCVKYGVPPLHLEAHEASDCGQGRPLAAAAQAAGAALALRVCL